MNVSPSHGASSRADGVTRVLLPSATAEPLELTIEPWGDVVFLAPQVDYVFEARDGSNNGPDVTAEYGEDFAIVWSHTAGADAQLSRADGTLVWLQAGPVPEREIGPG